MNQPPAIDLSYDELPNDSKERHEIFVNVFGEYLFWARNSTLAYMESLVDDPDARDRLGSIFREPFTNASRLNDIDRDAAFSLMREGIDAFTRELLRIFTSTGTSLRLGENHAIRFRLDMEICDLESGGVVSEETINRHGRKSFSEYWGQWLNRQSSNSCKD